MRTICVRVETEGSGCFTVGWTCCAHRLRVRGKHTLGCCEGASTSFVREPSKASAPAARARPTTKCVSAGLRVPGRYGFRDVTAGCAVSASVHMYVVS